MMVLNLFHIYNKMKNKLHDSIINDYESQKSKHLEKLASKMLKQHEQMEKLRNKKLNKLKSLKYF